jgi:hypothetical protein
VGVVHHVCLRLVYCFLRAMFVFVFRRCTLVWHGSSHISRIEVTFITSSHQLKTSMQQKHFRINRSNMKKRRLRGSPNFRLRPPRKYGFSYCSKHEYYNNPTPVISLSLSLYGHTRIYNNLHKKLIY